MQLTFFDIWTNTKRKALFFKKKKTKLVETSNTLKSSNKELLVIWTNLANFYFKDNKELKEYRINWSNRPQKRTLASCNLNQKKVLVARELKYEDYRIWLEPLIFHEMCHAVLGLNVERKNGKRQWHGKDFKELEKSHPLMNSFNKWIKQGGWATCVRSDRAKRMHAKRIKLAKS